MRTYSCPKMAINQQILGISIRLQNHIQTYSQILSMINSKILHKWLIKMSKAKAMNYWALILPNQVILVPTTNPIQSYNKILPIVGCKIFSKDKLHTRIQMMRIRTTIHLFSRQYSSRKEERNRNLPMWGKSLLTCWSNICLSSKIDAITGKSKPSIRKFRNWENKRGTERFNSISSMI